MHRQMADMMKLMSQKKGMFGRMMGGMTGLPGGGAAPSQAEMAQMQTELARLDPKALAALPPELKDIVAGAAPAAGKAQAQLQLPKGFARPGGGLPGLPGLGGRLPGLPGLPGFGGKKS